MLDGLRDMMAGSIEALAKTLGTRRYTDSRRIAYSGHTQAGPLITPDNSLQLPVMWRGLGYLTQTTGLLTWHVTKDGANGAEVQLNHTTDWLIWKRPNPEWSSFQLRETLIHWAIRWGNGYAEIEPNLIGMPYALWPIHPERVQVCRAIEPGEDAYGILIKTGDLYYEVNQGDAGTVILSTQRMFHIRGYGEGPVGFSVVHYAAESLGWARAVQMFGQSFFGNGANVAQVLINKKPIKPDGLRRQKAELDKLYKGPRNANKTAVFDNDAHLEQVGLDAEKSQLNETDKARAIDICRWLGVPPHKVYDLSDAHFDNLESQNTEAATDSIAPWAKRLEDEADYKLFGPVNRQGYYTKLDMRTMMRGDVAARTAYYKEMWAMGAYSPNKVLQTEGENTIGPQGDQHFVQAQYIPLEQILKQLKDTLAAKPQQPANDDADVAAAADAVAVILGQVEHV